MTFSFSRQILTVLAVALLMGCATRSQQSDAIAWIGTQSEIHFSELHRHVKNQVYDLRYKDPMQAHLIALDVLINNQLKRIDFFEQQLHLDDELMRPLRRTINEELVIAYFQKTFLGTYLTEANIQEMYELMGKEVTYQQIVLTNTGDAAVAQRVKELRNRLDAGESFDLLVSTYSEVPGAGRTGGYVDPINWTSNFDNPVHFAAFRMNKNEIGTIETPATIHIVRIANVATVPVKPLKEVRDEILKQLDAMYVDRSLKDYEDYRASVVNTDMAVWNEAAIAQVLEWSKQPRFFASTYRSTFETAIAAGTNPTILTVKGNPSQTVDLKRYLYLLDSILGMAPSSAYTRSDIKNHIIEALVNDHIVERANSLNLENEIFNPNTQNPVLKVQILRIYNQHMIQNQIPEPSQENLRAYYELVKDSTFYQRHTVATYVIVADDEDHARSMLQKHRNGTPFFDLAHEKLVRNFFRDTSGVLQTLYNAPQPELAKAAFGMSESQVDGPFIYLDPERGPRPAIMQVYDILEEQVLRFEDVGARIVPSFREYHYRKRDAELTRKLRSTYSVIIQKHELEKNLREIGLM